jgi:beta-galactosidase beta subunit
VVSDLLTNAHLYAALGTRIAQGLEFLAGTDLVNLALGRHEFDGPFMILWPGDAHMPGIDAGVPGPVRKVVLKIAVADSQP